MKKPFPHARNFHSRFESCILGLKISFSIENFNPRPCFSAAQRGARNENFILDWKFHSVLKAWFFQYCLSRLNFFNPGALWEFPANTLPALAPRPHPPGRPPPPLLGFSIKKSPPHPPGASDSPFPSPEQKKNKKYPKRPPSFVDFQSNLSQFWPIKFFGRF